jgi:predicted dehydrogenase
LPSTGQKLTAFVIGAGRMGRQHISNLHTAGLQVIGVFDKDPNKLEVAQKNQKVESRFVFDDFEQMCDSATPDLAVIATTTPSHCDFGIRLSKNGVKFLMIEKPLSASIAQCEDLAVQCEKAGTRVAVNHLFRYLPVIKKVNELLRTETFGGFTSLTVNGVNSGVAMMGSHFIDLFSFFSDSPLQAVSAWLDKSREINPRGESYIDLAGIILAQSVNGHRLVLDFPSDQGQGLEVLFCGRYGMLRCNLNDGIISGYTRLESDQSLPLFRSDLSKVNISLNLGTTDWAAASIEHLKNLINGGAIVGIESGTHVVKSLVAAHKSSELGHIPINVCETDKFRLKTFPWA